MDLDRHETYSMDLRGRRALPPPTTHDDDQYRSVRQALTIRHLLILSRQSRCSLAVMDGRGGGSASHPGDVDANIAAVGFYLRDCTPEQRVAIELEVAHPGMPMAHSHRLPTTARGFTRRQLSKCDVMAQTFGGKFYAERVSDLVADGLRIVQQAMERAGVLG